MLFRGNSSNSIEPGCSKIAMQFKNHNDGFLHVIQNVDYNYYNYWMVHLQILFILSPSSHIKFGLKLDPGLLLILNTSTLLKRYLFTNIPLKLFALKEIRCREEIRKKGDDNIKLFIKD